MENVPLRHLFLKYCGLAIVLILLSSEGQVGEAWEIAKITVSDIGGR